MKILLLIITALVLFCIYIAYPIIRAKHISKTIQEQSIPYEQHPSSATMKILVVGDSTGVGTGASTPKESIAGRIGNLYPTADIRNISENGIQLYDVQQKLLNENDTHYELLVLQIGANDVTGFTSRKKIEQELTTVLDFATTHASSTVVITAGDIGTAPVFRTPLSNLISWRTRVVRDIFIRTIHLYPTVTYVDLYSSGVDAIFNSDIPKYYAADHFHPSSDGYKEWFRVIFPR